MKAMELLLTASQLVAGFFLLIKAADWLVKGSSAIAKKLRVSDMMIGLTVVSFGTSTPELLVNIFASISGDSGIVLGNVIGSNLSNTLLILGLAATVSPLTVRYATVMKEIPFSLLAAAMVAVVANDSILHPGSASMIDAGDGVILLFFFFVFLYHAAHLARGSMPSTAAASMPLAQAVFLSAFGIVGLTAGGRIAVTAAESAAHLLGFSEALIGLTVIALGTSLPELTTSVVAAKKGNADIAIGNVIGSNVFNVFWILAISSLIRPVAFDVSLNGDLAVLMTGTVMLFFFTHTGPIRKRLFFWKQRHGHKISRPEGFLLLATYTAYLAYIAVRG